MSSIFSWSRISANNANADTDINWAEGQPASSVNNSARVMMQRVREMLDDQGGVSSATGTANSIAVSAASPFEAYANGLRVTFRASNNNSGATNINVNAIGSKRLVKFTDAGETVMSGGEVKIGCVYDIVYSTLLNGGAGAWLLLNPTPIVVAPPVEVPPGAVCAFAGISVPSGWLWCNGAAVSRSSHADLFAAIGTTYGNGDGSTTFNLPELRGEFIRGWPGGGSIDAGRVFGSWQEGMLGQHSHSGTTSSDTHSHSGTTNNGGTHNHSVSGQTPSSTQSDINPGSQILYSSDGSNSRSTNTDSGGSHDHSFTTSSDTHSHTITTDNTGGIETRPRNVSLLYCIKR